MKIEINTSSYNERRYSKPWIAKVDFSDGKGNFLWGQWIGRQGEEGILMIDVNPGDIIASGQKDFRKSKNSAADYYEILSGGKRLSLDSKAAAYRTWKENQKKKIELEHQKEFLRAIEISEEKSIEQLSLF